jgi:predicted phosphodiesterase
VRLAVITDIHSVPDGRPDGFWNAPVRFSRALTRLDEALVWLAAERPDVLLVLGDLTHDSDDASLQTVLARIDGVDVPRTIVLGGNHEETLLERLAAPEPFASGGASVSTLRLRHLEGWSFSADLEDLPPDGVAVVATHFPLVSRQEVFERRGLRYAGDLVNGDDLTSRLKERRAPTVVLAGHLHAPDAFTEGSLLQLVLPALVEGDGAASLVDVEAGEKPTVTVETRALDGDAATAERWTLSGGAWRPR